MKPIHRRIFVTGGIGVLQHSARAAWWPRRCGAEVAADRRAHTTGSQPDLIARWIVEPMAKRAGVPGIVVHRPGAAGAIAADAVLAATPESGALLLADWTMLPTRTSTASAGPWTRSSTSRRSAPSTATPGCSPHLQRTQRAASRRWLRRHAPKARSTMPAPAKAARPTC